MEFRWPVFKTWSSGRIVQHILMQTHMTKISGWLPSFCVSLWLAEEVKDSFESGADAEQDLKAGIEEQD